MKDGIRVVSLSNKTTEEDVNRIRAEYNGCCRLMLVISGGKDPARNIAEFLMADTKS
mgnify:CR=1 FL=1